MLYLRKVRVEPALFDALLHLPALTELDVRTIDPQCWGALGGLTQLRTLRFSWWREFSVEQCTALRISLNTLSHLSDLEIELTGDVEDRASGLTVDLRLPALRRLRLGAVRVTTLSFLQHSPLMEELSLSGCGKQTSYLQASNALNCLRSYSPLLTELRLGGFVRLSDDQRALLQPPSTLLPLLRTFDYYVRD